MKAGKLRNHLVIERNVAAALPNGEPAAPQWQEFTTARANIRDPRAKEILRGQELQHVISATIEIRYQAEITPAMRLKFSPTIYGPNRDMRVFEIVGIINREERDRELHLLCSEVTE